MKQPKLPLLGNFGFFAEPIGLILFIQFNNLSKGEQK
tara:strand:- start:3059 stop:3169 length:111 start_codon:yes stop_codon:yes gene_type:complete